MRRRVLWGLSFALAGAAGCGDSGEAPVSPPPVLPAPEPQPPLTDTLFLGFVPDRIEIFEGQEVAVDVAFEPFYRRVLDPEDPTSLGVADFRAVVEPGAASGEDLLVGGVRIGHPQVILAAGTTLLAMRVAADGAAEGPETLRLRLERAPNPHRPFRYPAVIEIGNLELEVVIRDAETADVGPDLRIAATKSRVVPPRLDNGLDMRLRGPRSGRKGPGLSGAR